MAMAKTKDVKGIDADNFTNANPKRNNPPAPKGKGGIPRAKDVSGVSADNFTNEYPKRSNPPAPKL